MGLMFGADGSEVRVAAVVEERGSSKRTIKSVVTFSCGCRYSEEREISLPRRTVGSPAVCYATHDSPSMFRWVE